MSNAALVEGLERRLGERERNANALLSWSVPQPIWARK
jgi:hypothetical protein